MLCCMETLESKTDNGKPTNNLFFNFRCKQTLSALKIWRGIVREHLAKLLTLFHQLPFLKLHNDGRQLSKRIALFSFGTLPLHQREIKPNFCDKYKIYCRSVGGNATKCYAVM